MQAVADVRTEEAATAGVFRFTERDFRRVVRLIHRHAGISLGESKRHMVYGRLGRRLRQLGLSDFSSYLELLEDDTAPEWEHFVNALTTNLTSFFREPHHFATLRQFLREHAPQPGFRLWCCASSTGEEPYSMAIAAAEAFSTLSPPVRILASDLDTRVLETAAAAVYPEERISSLPKSQLHRYFLRGTGPNAGMVRVREELRQLIEFRRINLLDRDWGLKHRFDAVFCRNVMIYFDKPSQRRILTGIHRHLAPHGLLFAGHSESFLHSADLFRNIGRTTYRPLAVD